MAVCTEFMCIHSSREEGVASYSEHGGLHGVTRRNLFTLLNILHETEGLYRCGISVGTYAYVAENW